jgi:RND family efflux transporter MFP subunit
VILTKKFSLYLALAGLFAALVLVWVMHRPPAPQTPPVTPVSNPYPASLAAAGIVEARGENVNIGVPVAGLVSQMLVKQGQEVAAGQPLFRLDDRELAAQLRVNQANVGLKQAQLTKLRGQLQRLQSVEDQRAISQEDLQNRYNDVAVAEAELKAAEAGVYQVQQLLDRLVVKAPKAGTVLQLNLRAGEFAANDRSDPVVVLGETRILQVRADVDEQNASRVSLTDGAKAFLKGQPERPIDLRFVRIEPLVVPKKSLTGAFNERVDTRVLQVIYEFDKGNLPVFVGQQVDVFLALDKK